MDDLESRIGSLSPAKRALLERRLRENAERNESDPTQRPQHWSSLIQVQPKGAKLPFFWMLGDLTNRLLPAALGPDQPLFGLEHQSIDGRPAQYTEVETIAKHYLDELRTVRPRGPYALGGFCFGAMVAFEMAQQLKREGEQVALVFMLDPPGAQASAPSSAPIEHEVRRHLRQLAPLNAEGKMHYLLPRINGYIMDRTSWIRKRIEKQRWSYCLRTGRLLPVSLRSRYILDVYGQAMSSYKPQPYSGSIVIFKARSGSYRPQLNWVQLATGQIEIHEYPGDHMALREEPQVRHWATFLKASLDRVQKTLEAGKL